MPFLRQLHDGMPDLLLFHGVGFLHAGRGADDAHAALGIVLHPSIQLHHRRARCATPFAAGIGNGSGTSSARGSINSAARGCVGCGRCITWCPVGIDITAEARQDPGVTAAKRSDGRRHGRGGTIMSQIRRRAPVGRRRATEDHPGFRSPRGSFPSKTRTSTPRRSRWSSPMSGCAGATTSCRGSSTWSTFRTWEKRPSPSPPIRPRRSKWGTPFDWWAWSRGQWGG